MPGAGARNSPIKAVVLTNGDVDALAGLLCLREGQPLTIYGSSRVLDVLAANSIFDVLDADIVKRVTMELGATLRGRRTDQGRSASPSSPSPCRARFRSISRPTTPREITARRKATRSA